MPHVARAEGDRSRSAIGIAVKSGWAAAVLLIGSPTSPRLADSRRIDLSDPAIPESRQPYHAGFGTARAGGAALTRLVSSVRRFGRRSVQDAVNSYATEAGPLTAAGLVVGSLIDPDRIANQHIRIHALEGKLFRQVVEQALAARGLRCAVWRERDLYGAAVERLSLPESHIRSTLALLGRGIDGSWRAEQKAAALAAWLILAEPGGAGSSRRNLRFGSDRRVPGEGRQRRNALNLLTIWSPSARTRAVIRTGAPSRDRSESRGPLEPGPRRPPPRQG